MQHVNMHTQSTLDTEHFLWPIYKLIKLPCKPMLAESSFVQCNSISVPIQFVDSTYVNVHGCFVLYLNLIYEFLGLIEISVKDS